MAERRFTRGLNKLGSAAQVRETVSQAVRESTILPKHSLVEPIDYETFITKNRTLLQNDPQRELLFFPFDDASQSTVPRRYRTTVASIPSESEIALSNLFVRQCLKTYSSDWKIITYKYLPYSGSFLQLPKLAKPNELQEQLYEVDTEVHGKDEDSLSQEGINSNGVGVLKEGYVLKGPESGTDSFISVATKSFKRRYMILRPQVDGTHIIEFHKDEKKVESKGTICLDFCHNVVRNSKRGKFSFELQLSDGHKPCLLVTENESELEEWMSALKGVISSAKSNTSTSSRKSALISSNLSFDSTSSLPSGQDTNKSGYGTLRGLEHSKNPELVRYSRETDFSITQARKENRQNLFSIYPEMQRNLGLLSLSSPEEDETEYEWNPISSSLSLPTPSLGTINSSSSSTNSVSTTKSQNDPVVEPFQEDLGIRILLTCEEIKFKLQVPLESEMSQLCQVEPYIATLAIFDIKTGRKVSEEFRFDVNHPHVRIWLPKPSYISSKRKSFNSNSNGSSGEHFQSTTTPISSPVKESKRDSIDPLYHLSNLAQDGWLSTPKQAILNLVKEDPDLYLVVRIEKVLQGGILQAAEAYLRPNAYAGDVRLCGKLQKHVKQCCQRLGHYRMPFAWAARPLFKRFSGELDTTPVFSRIYRQEPNKLSDEDLARFLAEHRRPEKLKNLVVIPGSLKISLKILDSTLTVPNTLTASLIPLAPFPMPPTHEATREIACFSPPKDCPTQSYPFTCYTNLLYVFPKSLKYDTQKTFAKARNIACIIELRNRDDEHSKPLQRIFARPGHDVNEPLSFQAITAVTHHNSAPDFYEEVKILLPCHVTEQHHLLFTFYHISCEPPKGPKKKADLPVENPVGYAWMPLLIHKIGRLQIEEKCLPVAAHLPSGYLSHQPLGLNKGFSGPEVRWVDGGKEVFKVGFELVSTVYTADAHLHNFFNHCQKVFETKQIFPLLSNSSQSSSDSDVKKRQTLPSSSSRDSANSTSSSTSSSEQPITINNSSIAFRENETSTLLKALHAVDVSTLISFLPTILNVLFRLLTNEQSEDVALNTVRVLVHILHTVNDVGKSNLLFSYIQYVFCPEEQNDVSNSKYPHISSMNGGSSSNTVHEALTKALTSTLRPATTDFLVVTKLLQHSWFFFQIIVKAMALHLISTDRIKMHRHERFPPDFQFRVENLLQAFAPHIIQKHRELPTETRKANNSLAHFLKRCLTFMDRGFVFRLITFYLEKFGPGDSRHLQEYKFEFIEILCSHEHFIALNLPFVKGTVTRGLTRSHKDFEQEYFLSEEFCSHHFLVGILLQEVKNAITDCTHNIRTIAVKVLRNLLAKHSFDDRYKGKSQQSRLSTLYLPFISILLENIQRLQQSTYSDSTAYSVIGLEGSEDSSPLDDLGLEMVAGSVSVASTPCKSVSSQKTPDTKRNTAAASFTSYIETDSKISILSTVSTTTPAGGGGSLPGSIRYSTRDSAYLALIAGKQGRGVENDKMSHSSSQDHILKSSKEDVADGNEEDASSSSSASPSRLSSHVRSHSLPFNKGSVVRFDKLTKDEVKDLLVCFLYIVKNLNEDVLIGWWLRCSETDTLNFFNILEICLHQFQYLGKKQIGVGSGLDRDQFRTRTLCGSGNVESSGTVPTTTASSNKAMTLPARTAPPSFNQRCNSTYSETPTKTPSSSQADMLFRALLEANMATEVGLITLDVLGLYGTRFKPQLLHNDGENQAMKKLLDIYLSFLRVGQSETLVKHLFASLRAMLNHYPVALFQGNANLCGKLCFQLLKCCDSKLSTMRNEACALLYLLMRSNFEFTSRRNLTRVHLQLIVSVSRLLGEVISLNNSRFQESLSIICKYADSDKAMQHTGFPGEVKDLTKRIRTVLMATSQLKEHENDAEMLVELQHSLANSYAATPALRETWLQSMARIHLKRGDFSEAAHCWLHMAALEAEYLKHWGVFPEGCEVFRSFAPNIPEDEGQLKEDYSAPGAAGISGINDLNYTEETLLEKLKQCAELLQQAERYEVMASLYKLIIPIFEKRRNFEALSNCHKTLHAAYSRILEVTRSGRRLLGRYYRVVCFGEAYFEGESGKEFIYKEPKVTSLAEISQRLLRLYSEKYGKEFVKLIMDSVQVEEKDLDPRFAHIQVTHVIPHFDETEFMERPTEFERQNNITRFIYETPFTRDGSGRARCDDITKQWKRQTILTTTKAFPYVKKRISVRSKVIKDLSPIEVAVQEMSTRVGELREILESSLPTDVKRLQLKLQGSICVQVNAGPLAYAKAFLQPSQNKTLDETDKMSSTSTSASASLVTSQSKSNAQPKPTSEQIFRLKEVYSQFVEVCGESLDLNERLIHSDQYDYQAALRATYQEMVQELQPLLLLDYKDLNCRDELHSQMLKRTSIEVFNFISGSPGSSTV